MMTTIHLATDEGVISLRRSRDMWQPYITFKGMTGQCLAADPLRPERVYCGTFEHGLWVSPDAGATWRPAGAGITHAPVMAVAVSVLERVGEHGVVWAGTEPSALFRSEDGGQTWRERPALRDLPSAPTWSFPPRPWTHHVRWITPDPHEAERLFVGIELGGVMRGLRAGETWEDRKPGSQHDAHTLRAHRLAPGRVYEAAGGGYAESRDGGATWRGEDDGLRHRYIWGLAVDPADPDTLVISAATSARQAHYPGSLASTLYRRTAGGPWQESTAGLPAPSGNRVRVLASNEAEPGVFYAANDQGIHRSPDAGQSWEPLAIAWPEGLALSPVHALLVVENG